MISISGLDFQYNKQTIIFDKFSLKVEEDIFGLIGVNGAGKSTLLKLLVGLLKPDNGNLKIFDIDVVKENEEVLKKIGVLFENPTFPSWTVVRDHLLYVGQLRGLDRPQAHNRAQELLEELELEQKANAQFDELSAGLKQRFGIAQALIGSPELVFLDEPTANLDAGSRVKVLTMLKNCARKEGMKIVILSHILSDLEKFCDGYAIIHNGELVRQENIRTLIQENYFNEYSIRFSDPKNIDKIKNRIDQQLEIENYNIIEESQYELIIHLETKSAYNKFNEINFPNDVSVSPTRSLLEQVFLNSIGRENQ